MSATLLRAVKKIVDNALKCSYCAKTLNLKTKEDDVTYQLYGTCIECYHELTN